jgi:hypothetical protein
LFKAEQIHKITTIFSQNDDFFFKPDHFEWKKLIYSACNNNYLSHLEKNHVIASQQPTTDTDVEEKGSEVRSHLTYTLSFYRSKMILDRPN